MSGKPFVLYFGEYKIIGEQALKRVGGGSLAMGGETVMLIACRQRKGIDAVGNSCRGSGRYD